MKAVILAAGAGRRLGLDHPKSMVEVGGRSILLRQLDAYRATGVEEFVIVVGFQYEQLRRHVQDQPGAFTFIVNERYAETNTLYSLYLAREHLRNAVYQSNADVVLDYRVIARLREATGSALAIMTHPCDEEEVKVHVKDGLIDAVGKSLPPETCAGEFIGVARYEADSARALADALTRGVDTPGGDEAYFEAALNEVCATHPIHAVDVGDLPCTEVDFPEDLQRAREIIAPKLQSAD